MPKIIVTDQCFPPLATPEGAGGCFGILRVEDASLLELADTLVSTALNRWLPRGTIVLISSGSYLAKVGVAQYGQDLVEAVNRIKRALPPTSFVGHGPMMFMNGLDNMGTIRAVSDICHWLAFLEEKRLLVISSLLQTRL